MKKVIVFGNSGSGKSMLAGKLSERFGLAHLDLDTLAWEPVSPPVRKPLHESKAQIDAFVAAEPTWVIEGCYADLLALAIGEASEVYYLNLPVAECQRNARQRPWEPHKYESKQAQDANLGMLLDWISAYTERDDMFSAAAHQRLYDTFPGTKRMLTRNVDSV